MHERQASTSTMWFISVSWLEPKCTWKALYSWCILWGLKYILCSAPLSGSECKIKNVDQQTWRVLISAGHTFTVQHCSLIQCCTVYHWPVTPQSSQCRLYQIILISHSEPSHLDKLLTSRNFWGHLLCPPAPCWPACSHMMEPKGRRVKESVHVSLSDVRSSGWHARLQPQAPSGLLCHQKRTW